MLTIDELIAKERSCGVEYGPFWQQKYLKDAPDSVRRNLELARRFPEIKAARQGFASADINDFPGGAFSAINTTTTETSFVGNVQANINQFCALAPNDPRAGKMYMIMAGGSLGTSSSAPTMIITPRWGTSTTMSTNVTLGASATVTMTASLSAVAWYYEFVCGIRTSPVGATGATAIGTGTFTWSNAATTAPYSQQVVVGDTAATVDTTGQGTAGVGLQTTVTWGTSAAANTLTCNYYIVRSLN